MSGVGFVIAAYIGAALLYGGYLLALHRRERALERAAERRNRA
jgi:hypothetical protein